VVRRLENFGKAVQVNFKNFLATRIESLKAGLARDEVQRSTPLSAGFRE
jgi:hypothetical protein